MGLDKIEFNAIVNEIGKYDSDDIKKNTIKNIIEDKIPSYFSENDTSFPEYLTKFIDDNISNIDFNDLSHLRVLTDIFSKRFACIKTGSEVYKKLKEISQIYHKAIIEKNSNENETTEEHFVQVNKEWIEKSEFLYSLYNLNLLMQEAKEDKESIYLELSAQKSSPEALYELGLKEIKEGKIEEGVNHLTLSAELGNKNAAYKLGRLYREGTSVKKNLSKAVAYLEQSAEKKHAGAFYQLYLIYNKECKDKLAFDNLKKACDLEDPQALYQMGILSEQGGVVKKDREQAFFYMELSYKLGCPEAALRLGRYYYSGVGVEINFKKAKECWESCPESSSTYSTARYNLGVMEYKGLLGEKNIEKSLFYLRQTSPKHSLSKVLICTILNEYFPHLENSQKEMKEIFNDFLKCYENKVKEENGKGEWAYYLSGFYEEGMGIEKDSKQAYNYLKISANLGFKRSYCSLYKCYYEGIGTDRDLNEAIYMLQKILDLEGTGLFNTRFYLILALHLWAGVGVDQNFYMAKEFLEKYEKFYPDDAKQYLEKIQNESFPKDKTITKILLNNVRGHQNTTITKANEENWVIEQLIQVVKNLNKN